MARRQNESNRQVRKRFQSHTQRQENRLDQRLLFIIACEGEKTERFYFESWFVCLRDSRQVSARSCIIAPHTHTNPTGVLADLQSYQDDGITFKDFDQRWIVIDRDAERTNGGGHTLEDFNTALQQSASSKPPVKVAWSNPCFELWYLLHFRYQNSGTDRDLIITQLSTELGFRYDKRASSMFDLTRAKLGDAMRNAKRLYSSFQSQGISPDQSNPCTTVYQLVEELQNLGGGK
ncbi:MAG: hypothetical protein A2Y38_24280 [Spirochaetes bacterium GWB1_59_5]|nr:MAG: hypothetical protein A2Y38_24280 [Spirochaetes bacterium GWB1_59_5]